ncbi:unnamed protein product [Thelazia callipaeda]|uniref:DPPIV_N domain-containing protein n=1 Tax=Thelazia callipaeda TaxID=103827 RepID=A0A0N5CY69_THECL|nr:unnamed protein product [Thelazia callipaeda]
MGDLAERNQMTSSSIPSKTADQLLLLPEDSACFTPNTSIESYTDFSGFYFATKTHKIPDMKQKQPNSCAAGDLAENHLWISDSKSGYSLFESDYEIWTENDYEFPNWSWPYASTSKPPKRKMDKKLHASSSFYHVLDMNTEIGKMITFIFQIL